MLLVVALTDSIGDWNSFSFKNQRLFSLFIDQITAMNAEFVDFGKPYQPPLKFQKVKGPMKFSIYILFSALCFFCSPLQKASKVLINAVDFELTTSFKMSCSTFKQNFKTELRSFEITDQNKIEELLKIINSLKPDKDNYSPDVRAQIVLFFGNAKTDTICMSDIVIKKNGKSYLGSSELVTFVEKTTATRLKE